VIAIITIPLIGQFELLTGGVEAILEILGIFLLTPSRRGG